MRLCLLNLPCIAVTTALASSSALAGEELKGRAEVNFRYGQERSITMTEFWVPFMQDDNSVLYGDLRMMGDNQDNREGNLGVGYRQITELAGFKGVSGVHTWIDRRITARGSTFHQATIGAEWLGKSVDILANGYIGLSGKNEFTEGSATTSDPFVAGAGVFVNETQTGEVIEEIQDGFDIELGLELGQHFDFIKNNTDSFRLYGGGFYFDGDNTENVAGWRTRFTADINPDIQIGARFQRDDERGSQGFLEATIRFPFGQKKSYRREGLRARLDESPERDIDIITSESVTRAAGVVTRVPVLNEDTGAAQEVFHVDNTAAGGGNGTLDTPFNTLAAAQGAASAHTIIYVNRGDGSTAGQNAGIALDKEGQQLIGSGTDFIYNGTVLIAAGAAPLITNAGGNGVDVSADNITVAGITVDGTAGGKAFDGIVVEADGGAASALNVSIKDVTAQNNRFGIYVHGANGGDVSASVQGSVTTANTQHGVAIYDDTNGTFAADLGGGSMGSTGNNVLAGNTLEDLAVELDGGTLQAQNNWWGQASGADTDTPDIGIAPQIYYGAPVNDGLVGHWTFDNEWTTNTTAYDRSGQGNDGTLDGGLSLADQVAGQNRQALDFDGTSHAVGLPSNASLDIGNNAVTLAVWVKLDQLPTGISGAINGVYDSLQDAYVLYLDKGNAELRFKVIAPAVAERPGIPSADMNTANWHLLTGVYDGDAAKAYVYLDGVLKDTHSNAGLINNVKTGQLASIGSQEGSAYFNGLIDNMKVYNRALSAAEISELYRADTSSAVNTTNFLTAAP